MKIGRRVLLWIIRTLARTLPSGAREWGRAASAEAESIDSFGGLARWTAGAARLFAHAWRRALLGRWSRLTTVAVVATLASCLAAITIAEHGSGTSRSHAIAHHGTAYGPAIRQLRNLTATWLECEYAHGARKRPLGGDSFVVVGITREAREACAEKQAAAAAIQRTRAFAEDAAATAEVTRAALLCVRAQGISLSGPEVAVAERGCKLQIEARRHLVEPAPLP